MENPVILACSGPALRDVDVWAPGYPVAAVSTAINYIEAPDYWILVDRMNRWHGQAGKAALKNPEVQKVVPWGRRNLFKQHPNVVTPRRIDNKPEADDAEDHMFDMNYPIRAICNQSVLFAVQWLARDGGFKELIFAGCDLAMPNRNDAYAHKVEMTEAHAKVRRQNLDRVCGHLRRWVPVAKKWGIRFLSWTPGSRINNYMEPFEFDDRRRLPNEAEGGGGGAAAVHGCDKAKHVEADPDRTGPVQLVGEVVGSDGAVPDDAREVQGATEA